MQRIYDERYEGDQDADEWRTQKEKAIEADGLFVSCSKCFGSNPTPLCEEDWFCVWCGSKNLEIANE